MPEFTSAMHARVSNAAIECMRLAEQKYNLKLVGRVLQKFNITSTRCGGMAGHRRGQYYVRWSPLAIAADIETYIKITVPHEIAHIVCYMNPNLGRNHDSGWKRVCMSLGGSGSRLMQTGAATDAMRAALAQKRAVRVQRRGGATGYLYRTASGIEITLTAIRHKKVLTGRATYRARQDGSLIGRDQFVSVVRQ